MDNISKEVEGIKKNKKKVLGLKNAKTEMKYEISRFISD